MILFVVTAIVIQLHCQDMMQLKELEHRNMFMLNSINYHDIYTNIMDTTIKDQPLFPLWGLKRYLYSVCMEDLSATTMTTITMTPLSLTTLAHPLYRNAM